MYNRNYGGFDFVRIHSVITKSSSQTKIVTLKSVTDGYTRPLANIKQKMKNINLTLILALLISIQLFSQDNNTKQIRLGINVGTNSFDLNKDDFFDKYEKKIGYSFGVSLEYILNENISIITNLNYDRKIMQLENFRYREIDGNDYTATDKLKFSYLNIPLTLRYYVVNKAFFGVLLREWVLPYGCEAPVAVLVACVNE